MPIKSGKDREGKYYRWGKTGKKYYYGSGKLTRAKAKAKATDQQRAIFRAIAMRGIRY